MVSLFMFELGSLICATAPNSITSIIGRAIAGIGTGGVFQGSVLIVNQSSPITQVLIFTGVIVGIYNVAGIAGPLWVILTSYL